VKSPSRGFGSLCAPDLKASVQKQPPPPEPKKRVRFVIWKSYTEAERIELYRRVWGESWEPASFVAPPSAPDNRSELIRQHMIVVEKVAGKLLSQGQNPGVQRDDLLVVGYEEIIHTIDLPTESTLGLDKRIARNAKTRMLRFIAKALQELCYAQVGWAKAVRAAHETFGFRTAEKYMRAEGRAADAAEQSTEAAEEAARVAREPLEKFLYLDWLHCSPTVFHKTRAYHSDEVEGCDLAEELAEIAHGIGYHFKAVEDADPKFPFGRRDYMRPVVECLRERAHVINISTVRQKHFRPSIPRIPATESGASRDRSQV
jgi:hypothetical protein